MSIKVNGVKKITNLTAASTINDADVFMIETTSGSRKVTGAVLKTLINNLVPDIDTTLSTTGQAADAKATGDAIQAIYPIIANEFDASLSYGAGDYVTYEGKLYRFTTAHETGIFDGTDAVEVNVTDEMVKDVTVNGESIVDSESGVAEIPVATTNAYGIMKVINHNYGLQLREGGELSISNPNDAQIKEGSASTRTLTPYRQHMATFYGLAKAAGHDEKKSTLPLGTYTEEAKVAIRNMIDATGESASVTVTGTDPVIQATRNTRYICGEILSLDFTPCSSGICEVIFTSGSSVTVLTLPETIKMPEWFEVETNHTYEISVVDGVYGAVMVW